MPTGKVKWYDADKGFGFLTRDDGGEVFVHSTALPSGTTALRPGQRVEFRTRGSLVAVGDLRQGDARGPEGRKEEQRRREVA